MKSHEFSFRDIDRRSFIFYLILGRTLTNLQFENRLRFARVNTEIVGK